MKILLTIMTVLVLLLMLFLYCACVISSRCSKEEKNEEIFKKIKRKN